MTGRPSTFSDDTFTLVCERVADGDPLAKVCREIGLPLTTFYGWMRAGNGGELSERFAHAREAGFDMIAAECIEIADNGGNNPNLAKVRVQTRLDLLAKWDPKRFGNALQVKHAGHEGQHLRDVSEGEAAARVAAILEAVRRRAGSGLEITDETGSV